MEREELLEQVTAALGESPLTLSERTINEELDAELPSFGDDDAANKALVEKIASRLRRLDGNLHAEVSSQVKAYKQRLSEKGKKAASRQTEAPSDVPEPADSADQDSLSELRKEVAALRQANTEREAAESKRLLLSSVERSLRDKFASGGLVANDYFIRVALDKLSVPADGTSDVETLSVAAEKTYNAEMKAAGVVVDAVPRLGAGGGRHSSGADDYFARKAKKEGWLRATK